MHPGTKRALFLGNPGLFLGHRMPRDAERRTASGRRLTGSRSPKRRRAWTGLFWFCDACACGCDWQGEQGQSDCAFIAHVVSGGSASRVGGGGGAGQSQAILLGCGGRSDQFGLAPRAARSEAFGVGWLVVPTATGGGVQGDHSCRLRWRLSAPGMGADHRSSCAHSSRNCSSAT